jgi:hypothetical protein
MNTKAKADHLLQHTAIPVCCISPVHENCTGDGSELTKKINFEVKVRFLAMKSVWNIHFKTNKTYLANMSKNMALRQGRPNCDVKSQVYFFMVQVAVVVWTGS